MIFSTTNRHWPRNPAVFWGIPGVGCVTVGKLGQSRLPVGVGAINAILAAETGATVHRFARDRSRSIVVVAVPAHKLGDDQVQRLARMPQAAGIKAAVWRSRKAKIGNKPMCHAGLSRGIVGG